MLPGVLLQHLQTPWPSHCPCYYLTDLEWHVSFQVMQHTAILSHGHGCHARSIERPYIVWLPAAARVEGRLVEHYYLVAVLDKIVYHLSGELGEMGIVPVEFRGHKSIHGLCEVKDIALPGIGSLCISQIHSWASISVYKAYAGASLSLASSANSRSSCSRGGSTAAIVCLIMGKSPSTTTQTLSSSITSY